jgi:hypothetical protein
MAGFLQEMNVFCSSAYETGGFLDNYVSIFDRELLKLFINIGVNQETPTGNTLGMSR